MDFAWMIARVQNILLRPKDEWYVVDGEEGSPREVLLYVGILACIPAAVFLLFALIYLSIGGIVMAILYPVIVAGLVYVFAYIIDFLAPHFDTEKHMPSALKLAGYSITPMLLAAAVGRILSLLPAVGWILSSLVLLAALVYFVYLFYYGILILMRSPVDKAIGYAAAAIGIQFAVSFAAGLILGAILFIR